ncbi:hypothetical protein SAMN06264365_103560 [Actinoplanes regularis]|uniref:Uncharacterized protein n=1 Tax=Actinoplanes regularis TaxID=52697 RepID=A0A238XLB7_9ACTN|nr:hypothetical protein SAMN06264365_103560 [Actinoplanes regularis]
MESRLRAFRPKSHVVAATATRATARRRRDIAQDGT